MASIAKYIGVPYTDKGRDFDGVDCWGLVQLFYKNELGVSVPDYLNLYATALKNQQVAAAFAVGQVDGNWVEVKEPQLFDVLLFRIKGVVSHCGLYVGNNEFVHAFNKTDVCAERLHSISWRSRLTGIRRWQTR